MCELIINEQSLTETITQWMTTYDVKAGQVTFAQLQGGVTQKDINYVYNNNFGYVDYRDEEVRVMDNTLFRIASASKLITSIGILTLINKNILKLDDKAFVILADKCFINPSTVKDKRIFEITIENLLQHSAGWDVRIGVNDHVIDPMFDALRIAKKNKDCYRDVTPLEIVQYVIKFPLNYDPGTKYVYSNFGYTVLGRVIEAVTCRSYEDFIKNAVFRKVHAKKSYIGGTVPPCRLPDEVLYYDGIVGDQAFMGYTINPCYKYTTTNSYGLSFILSASDSHGGWVTTSTQLIKVGYGLLTNKFFSYELFLKMITPIFLEDRGINYGLGVIIVVRNGITFLFHIGAWTWGTLAIFGIVPECNIMFSTVFNHLNSNTAAQQADLLRIIIQTIMGTSADEDLNSWILYK